MIQSHVMCHQNDYFWTITTPVQIAPAEKNFLNFSCAPLSVGSESNCLALTEYIRNT